MFFKISLKDTSFHISINSQGLNPFLQNACWILSGEWSSLSKKMHWFKAFLSCPSPLKTRPQVLVITPEAEGNYSFPLAAFFRKSVSPTWERAGGNYDLLYQNSVRKYKDDLQDQVFYILYDLQFFQMWWLYSFVNNIHHIVCY